MLSAVLCWSASAVGSRSLLSRHSPLVVTGCSMAIGTVLYLAFEWRAVAAVDWRSVSTHAWWSIVLSAVFALCVAYMIWYTALQRVGNTRTAVYSNLVPVAGMIVAWSWLGESIEAGKIVGAVAILTGVTLTKLQSSTAAEMHVGLQPGTTDQPPLIPASDPQSPSRFNSASARARVDG
jgi:drug/metabolite transporter (DMT)-like permease